MYFSLSKGPRIMQSEIIKYNKLIISDDDDFIDRYHLTYMIEPKQKDIPNKEIILDVNPFMMRFGFIYLYIFMMWFYVIIFGY